MNRCKTCRHWQPYREAYPRSHASDAQNAGGVCRHVKIVEDASWKKDEPYVPDALVYDYDEGGDFWTGPEFGCVLHEEKA